MRPICGKRLWNCWGEKAYFEEFLRERYTFKEKSGIKGLKFVWVEGMERVCKAWGDLADRAAKGNEHWTR
jgi:hypothetical protein